MPAHSEEEGEAVLLEGVENNESSHGVRRHCAWAAHLPTCVSYWGP
jgi:hypothetical protein